jgi:lipopolysaccharide transport system ATP-binding protein
MTTAIKIENVSKLYRLGTVGTGTIAHDLNRWWHQIRGKEDPYAKVGQVNDRTKKAGKSSVASRQSSENAAAGDCQLPTANSREAGPDYVWALKDINLEVAQGEILGIIGRNGAGKSTLLKLLSRVTAPTTGSIKTKGRIASLLEVGTGFHPDLTGRENIYMNGAILGMRRHEITRQLDEIVDFSGCAKYLDTPVKRYSSGMTVRLGFAVAAHLRCEILIVDEVLSVGDYQFQVKCIDKLKDKDFQSERTVLFVSHNLNALRALCTRGVILSNGNVDFDGTADAATNTYLQSQRPTGDCPPPLRKDGQVAAITSLTLLSDDKPSQSVVGFEQKLRIVMEYEVVHSIQHIHLYVELVYRDQIILVSFDTDERSDLLHAERLPGKFCYRISLPGRLLKPGPYMINCGIGVPRGPRLFEWNSAAQFEVVLESGYEATLSYASFRAGTVAAPLKWNS